MSHPGELAALGTAFCWTITALSFESAGRRVGSLSVNFIRLIIAMIFLTVFCTLTRGRPFPSDASAHAWLWLAISGLVGFGIGDLCLFRAFVLVGARISMLIMSLAPVIAALLGWVVLGEHPVGTDWLGMALTIAGVAWVVRERRPEDAARPSTDRRRGPIPAGVLLALGGAAGQAVGLVMSKVGMGDYNAFAATQIRVLAGVVGFAVLFFFLRWWPRVREALQHRAAMRRITLGATFGPFLGVSLSLVAVQHTQTGIAATIMSIVPVLIIAPAILIFREKVSPRAMVGAVAAVAGVAILFLT